MSRLFGLCLAILVMGGGRLLSARVLTGDCRAVLPTLAAGAIDCCVTSPPYWEQREYLEAGHADKALEIGHEPTPTAYVAALVAVFLEVQRVLADDGTLWLNLGDKYAADGGRNPGGGHFGSTNRLVERGSHPRKVSRERTPGFPPKSLIGLPWRVAFALQDDGWILRSEIIWEKPNAQPSSVKDRPTTSHEHLFLFSKSEHYYYDQDALREPTTTPRKSGKNCLYGQRAIRPRGKLQSIDEQSCHPLGRNSRTVWTIPTEASDGSHVAPMPRELAKRCILAGCPAGGTVLDPFGGRGTVGAVAATLGRHALLIDLDPRAIALANSATAQQGLIANSGGAS